LETDVELKVLDVLVERGSSFMYGRVRIPFFETRVC
jgi:hypothetical protein